MPRGVYARPRKKGPVEGWPTASPEGVAMDEARSNPHHGRRFETYTSADAMMTVHWGPIPEPGLSWSCCHCRRSWRWSDLQEAWVEA